jgi:hypothetical protein
MKGLKQCDKGHYFEENIDVCPYCPKQSVPLPKTESTSDKKSPKESPKESPEGTDVLKTEIYAGTEKAGGSEPPVATKIEKSPGDSFDPLKTTITPSNGAEGDKGGEAAQRRKLRGWLVTFDLFEFGTDFKIIEGRNTIGKDAKNEITIKDSEVSGSHAIILCRHDEFIIEDEMSTNGTYINGTELGPRSPHVLSDGDKIKIGKIELLFKKAF